MTQSETKDQAAERLTATYNQCIAMLDYAATLTSEEISERPSLSILVAMPLIGLAKCYTTHLQLLQKLLVAGIAPTASESALTQNLGNMLSKLFNQLETGTAEVLDLNEAPPVTMSKPTDPSLH